MRLRWFLAGLLTGMVLAQGRATWRKARDQLARAIDALLRVGVDASS